MANVDTNTWSYEGTNYFLINQSESTKKYLKLISS